MIAGLRGRLENVTADALLVDVGGVIYRVYTSATTRSDVGSIGDDVRLVTHLFVREDQLTLYGFATGDELKLFEVLIGITGVGPRLACAILSHIPSGQLYDAISQENVDFLATVPGVGRKTASRMVLELRGKLPEGVRPGPAPAGPDDSDVVEALRALGYTAAEAHGAVMRAAGDRSLSVEDRVLAALRELGEA